jgi:short-subunit dehydrogenase
MCGVYAYVGVPVGAVFSGRSRQCGGSRRAIVPIEGRINVLAVVTGASAGIGEAFATRLAAERWDLVITARRRQRLESLAERLMAAHRNKVRVLVVDLTVKTEVSELLQLLTTEDVDLLVNNAGFGGYAPFVEADPRVIDDLIAVHISAVSQLSRAVLPGMIRRNTGAVINVASLLAFSGTMPPQPLPYRATYAGAKAYLVAFTQALAGELVDTAVRVQVCCPGLVATEFHADFDLSGIPLPIMDPMEVVDAALKGVADGEVVCVPGLEDASMIDQLGDVQRTMLLAASSAGLATRYRPS